MERKSTDPYHAFFSLNKDGNGLVKFEQLPGFEMQLDVEMVKFLNLPLDASWLIQTVIGSKAVVMKPLKLGHLYIHCDCLHYHYINNNVSDFIKAVTNNATVGEKVIMTFDSPHYYAVARRFMQNINMFVTDNLFDGILRFDREVVYMLHFRRCLHPLHSL